MLRIFVTGDNHIGLKYASHKQSTVLASNRLTTFESMVQAANQESCDLLLSLVICLKTLTALLRRI